MTIQSNTRYDWRMDVIRNHAKIGEARIKECTVDFVENADVTRTMKVKIPTDGFDIDNIFVKQDEILIYFDGTRCFDGTWCFSSAGGAWVSTTNEVDLFVDRLRPIMIIDDVEYNLGDYMIISAPITDDGRERYYDIEAYDEVMVIKQSALRERKYYSAGTAYMTILSALIIDCGLTRILGDNTSAAITVDHEYAAGTPHLTIINELLDEIGYSHIYAGQDGNVFLSSKKTKFIPDYIYTENNSTLTDTIQMNTDIYSLPNVIVGYTSNPDNNTVLRYEKVNSDPASAISTARRGYNVVEFIQLDDCPNLTTLQLIVNNKYMEVTQATETATITTMPDGLHAYGSYVSLGEGGENALFREVGWSIDFNGKMTHSLERKAYV